MSNTFKKTGLRGFTLIELLVVIAIIGLLSTVIAAPITQARKKGRDGKKVADLHQIQGSLQQYADDNMGNYPINFVALVPKYLANIPNSTLDTAPRRDKYQYVYYENSSALRVGFHLGTKLEAPGLALGDDRDCVGNGSTTDPLMRPCIDNSETIYTSATDWTLVRTNAGGTGFANDLGSFGNISGFISENEADDFAGGMDTASTSCTALTNADTIGSDSSAKTCIYDITN